MKDYGWLPGATKRSGFQLDWRSAILVLALSAALATSAVAIKEWVWSGQNPHRTLDFDKALKVIRNPEEHEQKRNTANVWLYVQMLRALKVMKEWEESAPSEFKGNATHVLNQLEKAARVK
jgi:hypothetical protein